MVTQTQSSTSPQPSTKIDPKLALESLPGGPDDELDLDGFESNLIKQTAIARDMGEERAKAFFRAMIGTESGGREDVAGKNPRGVLSKGRWQISDETAKSKYKLDNTNPALNRYMGVDYWNEGYERAKEISDDPRVRAAIATAYYHHGPATIDEMKRNGGVFPSTWDGGTTTNDHVYKVMEGWKGEIEKAGLNFDLTPTEEPVSDPPITRLKINYNDEFSGSLTSSKSPSNITGPKPDPRDPSTYLTFGVNLSTPEKVKYFKASPERRAEMQLEMIAKAQPGDPKKNLEALKRYRDYEPDAFVGLEESAQIGVVDEVSIGAFLPRLMKAYNESGAKGFDEELVNVKSDIANFTLETQGEAERSRQALNETSQTFRDWEGKDPIDTMAASSLAQTIHQTLGGGAGILGAVAGRFGLDELDRELTKYSELANDKARIIAEEQDLLEKRSMIPGLVFSGARDIGALPVTLGTLAVTGPTPAFAVATYTQSLAQAAREKPLDAIALSVYQGATAGLGLRVLQKGAKAKDVAKFVAIDSFTGALPQVPSYLQNAAIILYAKQNPGKVSKKELEQANQQLNRLGNDIVAGLLVGGGFGVLGTMGNKGGKVDKVLNLGLDGSNQFSFFMPKVVDPVAQGAITSIAHVISPELAPSLVGPDKKPLGRVYLGAELIPGEDYYLARFTNKDGKILPGELISKELKDLYDKRLARVGKLEKEGASPEVIAEAIIEAQPTEIELGISKVAALIEQESKVVEAESAEAKYQAEKGKFDENLAKFQAKRDELKAQLAQFQKFADEPQVITQFRKSLKESATGGQANMGANVLQQAVVTGYDLYRTLKEAGKGFAEWLKEMTQLVSPEAHPYLPDVWEKLQFLNETKTRGAITRGEDGTWKFEGEPVKVYHATSAGTEVNTPAYNKALTDYNTGMEQLNNAFNSGALTYEGFKEGVSKLGKTPNIEDFTEYKGFSEFSTAKYGTSTDIGWYGIGIYFGDLTEAHKYAHGPGSNIRPNYLRVENPLVWEYGKDSSIQRFLGQVRVYEKGGFGDYTPRVEFASKLELPKAIHEDVVNFVQTEALRYRDSIKEQGFSAPDALLTEQERHQLSRGITTIMKDKGYDGVFVIEEKATGYKTEIKDLKQSITNIEKDLQSQFIVPKQKQILEATLAERKSRLDELAAMSDFRIKEYVAFSPDQILSTLDSWTPRNITTGEKLSPTSSISKVQDAISKFISEEKGEVDLIAILDMAEKGADHLIHWGRNLDRFFVKRGKNLRAESNAVRDEYLVRHSERLIEIEKEITANGMAYSAAKGPARTSLTAELKRLAKEKVELTAEVTKLKAIDYGNEATSSWLNSINANVTSKGLLLDFGRKATPLLKALGTTLDEYYKYRMQDRLEGARQRYLDWANSIDAMTEDDVISSFLKFQGTDFYSAIKAMNDVAPGSFENAKTILHNLRDATDSGDYSLVKAQLKNTFNLAASMITTKVKPDYAQYRANGRLDEVNNLYKTIINEPLRLAFDRTDSVPSGYLGADDLYFPLMSEAPVKGTQVKKGTLGGLRPFKRAELQKPKSPAAHFTTGLSNAYSSHVHDMQQVLTAQLRAGDRAGFIQRLIDLGIARPRAKTKDLNTGGWIDEPIPDGYVEIDAGPERVYSSKTTIGGEEIGKTFSPPAKKLIVPKELYKDIEPLVSTIGVYSENDINKLVGKLTGFAILGILEPVYHGWNVIDGLRGQLGWLPTDIWATNNKHAQAVAYLVNKTLTGFAYAPTSAVTRALESIPGLRLVAPITDLRTGYAFGKAMSMNMFSPDQVKRDKMWKLYEYLLERGSIPERIGHTTYSPEIANLMGSHLVGPMQYKAIRKMYEKVTGREVPDPAIDPGKFQEGSWWDETFTGTRWQKPLEATKKFASSFSMSPLVFGWNGIDMRARLAVAEAIQHYRPDATPFEVFEITSLLGVYNRFAESKLGNVLKRTQVAPFYSASSARSRRVTQSWTRPFYGAKSGLLSGSDKVSWPQRIAAHFQESSLTYVTMWALTHHQLTGQWPWEDEESRLLKIKVSADDIRKNKALAAMFPSGAKDGYVSYAPFFGGAGGSTMFGLDGLWKAFAATNGDDRITTAEKLDLGARIGAGQVATSYAHVVGSGPLVHILPKVMFNVDPAISYVPSARGGGEYKLLQHNLKAYGASSWAKRTLSTLLETNAMLDNAAGFVDASPNEFESVDNPWNAEVMKFFFQLASHNYIKSQENPGRTSGTYRKSILKGRTKVNVLPGAYRKFTDNDDE